MKEKELHPTEDSQKHESDEESSTIDSSPEAFAERKEKRKQARIQRMVREYTSTEPEEVDIFAITRELVEQKRKAALREARLNTKSTGPDGSVVLFCIKRENIIRKCAKFIHDQPWFEPLVTLIILANCVFLALGMCTCFLCLLTFTL
jgi:hypothetical protein